MFPDGVAGLFGALFGALIAELALGLVLGVFSAPPVYAPSWVQHSIAGAGTNLTPPCKFAPGARPGDAPVPTGWAPANLTWFPNSIGAVGC